MALGFEIVCKDKKRRHLPYWNKDDADFDAGYFDEHGTCECRDAGHTIEPVAIVTDDQKN